jgi:RHS repeat-associated protein
VLLSSPYLTYSTTNSGGNVNYMAHPFGMLYKTTNLRFGSFVKPPQAGQIKERSKTFDDGYRYGFNGEEKDNEVSGEGSSYTTHYRQYDSRLGRWFSRDPSFILWQTPYASMNNFPIVFNDPLGDEIEGTRKTKRAFRQRERAAGTWRVTRAQYRRGNTNGINAKEMDLKLEELRSEPLSITNAVIQPQTRSGSNSNPNRDHLYFSPFTRTVTRKFTFNNRVHRNIINVVGATFGRIYPGLPIDDGFTTLGTRFALGKTLGEYINKNNSASATYAINVDFVNIKRDDINTRRPAVYTFLLNGTPWNIFTGGGGCNPSSNGQVWKKCTSSWNHCKHGR